MTQEGLEGKEWWCPVCSRLRKDQSEGESDDADAPVQSARFLLGVQPAAAVLDEMEVLPDASDLEAQKWSLPFRKAVRTNARLQARPCGDVDWADFQRVRRCLQEEGPGTGKANMMINFILKFMQSMNTRLNERDDFFLLEACSLFDPAERRRNYSQYAVYLKRLLESFPHENALHVRSGVIEWMKEENKFDKGDDIILHYKPLCLGNHPYTQVFGYYALNVLKNIPSNAIVESRFSTAAQVKSTYRIAIGDSRMRGLIFFREEDPFGEVSFEGLMDDLIPVVGPQLNEIRGLRGSYKHRKEKPPD